MRRSVDRQPGARNPARLVPLAFLAVIVVGTLLLMLPVARAGPGGAPPHVALFTAVSATCVTGLTVVDTATYWTGLGQVLVMLLTQIGAFGIITAATLLTLLISHRLGISTRLRAVGESKGLGLGNVRQVVTRVAKVMAVSEGILAVILAASFWLDHHLGFWRSLWYGLFHAVSAFNNAGFSLFSDSLEGFVGDWWICVPLTVGVIAGSLGFPALFEVFQRRRPGQRRHWSTHTRLTLVGTALLLAVGFAVLLSFEWDHAFAGLDVPTKILAAFTQGSMPRSGGFNSVDYGGLHDETNVVVIALMFIGGGSAGTAGGIKLTTFLLLAAVILAEVRGEADVVIGHRRIAESTQRQAVAVALLGVAVVATGTLGLIATTSGVPLRDALFEATSAFATVGLSTGITPTLPVPAQLVLVILMFVGRVGTVTVAATLALTTRPRLYRYPEERPIVG